jgi:hypothetical protein
MMQAATSNKLKREMEDLEAGSIFRHLNITNFLEGDLFAWYLPVWSEPIDKLVRDMVSRLDGYNPGTLSEDPAISRDMVKKLYQQLFPKSAASAISKVTGEDPEEIKGSLNGQLESEIDPAKVYQRALVEGNLNKETQQEIADAVQRAKRAYEIATQSLFRDVSSYSFDNYRRELASDLTLNDLHTFTMRFLTKQRRQVRRQGAFLEFLVPDVLKSAGLPDRYQAATFDRKAAIERSDVDFLAIGHPLIDSILAHVGSYDFGGLAAVRRIEFPALAGRSGFLFVFVVRRRVSREDAEECLFEFRPVFVTPTGEVDEEALQPAVNQSAAEIPQGDSGVPDPSAAFRAAQKHLEETAELWEWLDDVEFIGLSWVEFLPE